MAKIWELNQGHSDPKEGKKNYARFKAYLKLGPSRSFPELAKRIGVTRQAIGVMARKYNWNARAAAWDGEQIKEELSEDEYDLRLKVLPPPPKIRAEKEKVIEEIVEAIEVEVLEDVLETEHARRQLDNWEDYQKAHIVLGKEMLSDADNDRKLSLKIHKDLNNLWDERLRAIEEKDYTRAMLMCAQIKEIMPQYWKLGEKIINYRQHGSRYWGDAIGVRTILEAAYKPKKE